MRFGLMCSSSLLKIFFVDAQPVQEAYTAIVTPRRAALTGASIGVGVPQLHPLAVGHCSSRKASIWLLTRTGQSYSRAWPYPSSMRTRAFGMSRPNRSACKAARILSSLPRWMILSTPRTAIPMPSPVSRSPFTVPDRPLRLITRTSRPSAPRRLVTRRPRVPVPPVTNRFWDFIGHLLPKAAVERSLGRPGRPIRVTPEPCRQILGGQPRPRHSDHSPDAVHDLRRGLLPASLALR